MTFTNNGLNLTQSGTVYALNQGTPVVTSQEGIPLVTRVAVGANQILYLNYFGTGAFGNALAQQVMGMVGVTPEVIAPTNKTVNLYSIGNGHSAVIWDQATISTQAAYNSNYGWYARVGVSPTNIVLLAPSNTVCTVYDFFANTLSTVTSSASGQLTYVTSNSVDIVYYGPAADPAFAQTIASAQATRNSLVTYAGPGPQTSVKPAYSTNTGSLALSATTVAGWNYVLETTPSLQAPITWTAVSTNAGTGGVITNSVPVNPAALAAFFRYLIQ